MTLPEYITHLNNRGIWSFTYAEARRNVNHNLPYAIQRMRKAGRIIDPARGFYVIIPEEISLTDRLPADRYIDDLMKYHGLPYYTGLLTAAAYYGSSHQSPQVFQVITNSARRPIRVRGGGVKYFSKKTIHETPIRQRNTPTGYLNISTPEVTILDLIKYSRWVGGMDNVANVISEMIELVKIPGLKAAIPVFPIPILQRAGYVFDVLRYNPGVKLLKKRLVPERLVYTPVEAAGPPVREPKNENWKIIINTDIEPEY